MDALFHTTFLSTKEAGKISGYSSDYLSLLARSGKIDGKRVGHNWILERESLMSFLERRVRANVVRAEELARLRADEYRAAQASAVTLPVPRARALAFAPVYSGAVPGPSFLANAGAALASVLVLLAGMYGSQMTLPSGPSQAALALVDEAASGARDMAALALAHAVTRFTTARTMGAQGRIAAQHIVGGATDALAYPPLAYPDTSAFMLSVPANTAVSLAAASAAARLTSRTQDLSLARLDDAVSRVSLASVLDALRVSYLAIGATGYAGIRALEQSYVSALIASGPPALALGTSVRDFAAALPAYGYAALSAIGQAEVVGTHAAIHSEVALAYVFARGGPAVSEQAFGLAYAAGGAAMLAAAHAERDAVLAFALVSAWPAAHAPALAATVWNTEYAFAARFAGTSERVAGGYLALVHGAGDAAYTGTHGALAYLARGSEAIGAGHLYAAVASALGLAPSP